MPKQLELLILLGMVIILYPFKNAQACDVCGGAVSTVSTGILPNFYKHYIGLYSGKSGLRESTSLGNKPMHDEFTSFELRARVHVYPKWQLFVSVPLNKVNHRSANTTYKYTALGDISLWGLYTALSATTNTKIQHLWQIGGGMKMPSGRYDFLAKDQSWIPGAQAGTGSFDFLGISQYIVRTKQVGLQTGISGRLNRSNDFLYRFGHRMSASLTGFYQYDYKGLIGLPFIGLQYELSGNDRHGDERMQTQAQSAWIQGGLDIYKQHISAGIRWQLPVLQQLSGLQSLTRFNMQLLYNF